MRTVGWEHSTKRMAGRRAMAVTAAISLSIILIAGCGIEAPQSPSWSVSLEIPLASRTFDIQYIADYFEIEELDWASDSVVAFHIARDLDTVFVSDHLQIDGFQSAVSASIGQFALATGVETGRVVPLSELYNGPVGLIASFSTVAQLDLPAVDDIQTADIVGGDLQITLVNNLGITLDSVVVSLLDAGGSNRIGTVELPGPIATGASVTGTAPLSAGQIGSDWSVELEFYTPGGTILSAAEKSVEIHASLPSGLRVSTATGVIPPVTWEHGDSISISPDHQIHNAVLGQGTLNLTWQNSTPLPLSVTWNCGTLVHDGSALAGTIDLPPGAAVSTSHDLSGYEFTTTGTPSYAGLTAVVTSAGSGGGVVTLTAGDGVSVAAEFSAVTLASATAALAPTTQSIDPLTTEFDWSYGIGDIGLADGNLVLSVTSSLPWSATVTGTIDAGDGRTVPVAGTIAAGSPADPVTTELMIAGVSTLLSPLPSRLTVEGSVEYGDGATVGHISAQDYLAARVVLDAPAHLYVDSVSLQNDIRSIDLASDDRLSTTDRLLGGTVTIVVKNHLPLGTLLTLSLASDSMSVTANPELVFGPSRIEPAATNGDGTVTGIRESTLTFAIDRSEIQLFENDEIWVGGDLMLVGPGNDAPARIGAQDYIDWHATLQMDVQLGTDNAGEALP